MKKVLALAALCLGLNNTYGGLESLTNDSRAIVSKTRGEIDLPIDLGRKCVQEVALLGKIAREFGNSPHNVSTNGLGNIIFYTDDSITSVVESVNYSLTEEGFRNEIGLSGNRPFSNFEAYLVLDCIHQMDKIGYEAKMYTILKSSIIRRATNGIGTIPYFDRKIKAIFQKEQEQVIQMMNTIAKQIQTDPRDFLERMKGPTEKVKFTGQEIKFIEEVLKCNGFLKE